MDPLSIAASVTGLVLFSAKVVGFLSEVRDAPTVAGDLLAEVQAMHLIFEQLRNFVHRFADHDKQCISRIDINGLVTILTGCVCTFSEIDGLLENCDRNAKRPQLNLWDRSKWATKTSDITRLVGKLQSYKSSLTLLFVMLVPNMAPAHDQTMVADTAR